MEIKYTLNRHILLSQDAISSSDSVIYLSSRQCLALNYKEEEKPKLSNLMLRKCPTELMQADLPLSQSLRGRLVPDTLF